MATYKNILMAVVLLTIAGLTQAAELGLSVDNIDDIAVYSATGNFNVSAGTMQLWVKANNPGYDGTGTNRYFIGMDNNTDLGNRDQFGIMDNSHAVPTTAADPANFRVFGQGTFNAYGTGSGLIDISDWAHITVTWTQTLTDQTLTVYINGVFKNSATIAGIWGGAAGNEFGVGGRGEAPSFREGAAFATIDELRIKNVALNAAQVLADYNQMAVNKIALTADGDTTFLAHFDSSTTADFSAGVGTANFGGVSTGVLDTGYQFIPEPSSLGLMGIASLLALYRRR